MGLIYFKSGVDDMPVAINPSMVSYVRPYRHNPTKTRLYLPPAMVVRRWSTRNISASSESWRALAIRHCFSSVGLKIEAPPSRPGRKGLRLLPPGVVLARSADLRFRRNRRAGHEVPVGAGGVGV
jgi:hypothetical protein